MEVSLIMIDEPCYKPPEPSFVITAQPQTLIMFRIVQQQKYNVFQRNCQKENFVWALINILVPNIFWGKLLFWNLDILRWFPKRRSKRAAEKIHLYFWFVLEMRSKTKSKLSLTHNVNDLTHFWKFSKSVSNSWMFHPRIMFNVTEAKGKPRWKASYHALCFQFLILRECYNESLLAPSGALIAIPTYYWPTNTNHYFKFSMSVIIKHWLSLSDPLQIYQKQSLDSSAGHIYTYR